MTEIDSIGQALAHVKGILGDIQIGGSHGPAMIFTYNDTRYLLMHKRDYYKNFKHHFPEVLKEDGNAYGWAQIMSMELLDYCIDHNIAWVAFVTPDGKSYCASAKLFKKFVERHGTYVPHLKGEVAMPLEMFENIERRIR